MSPASTSRLVSPTGTSGQTPLVVVACEQLETNYQVHELLSMSGSTDTSTTLPWKEEVLVNTALLTRIEALEAENSRLRGSLKQPHYFRLEDIQDHDRHIRFYTGFSSYVILMAFFEFLGLVVHELKYWGTKQQPRQRHHSRKLDPLNRFFSHVNKAQTEFESRRPGFLVWNFS